MPEVLQLFEVGDHGPGFSAFQKALELRGTITQLNASFRLTNVGASDATMHYMGGTVFVGERLPHSNPAIGKPLGTGFTGPIKPGHTTRTSIPTRPVTTQELYDIRMGYTSIFVVGKLIYHDALKNYRRTGFARRFDASSGRFWPVPNDPDYEYED